MELVNLSTGQVIAEKVEQADTFGRRLKGLMFRKSLPDGHALHLKPCQSIHTFFMRFPIDVIYLNEANRIVSFEENIPVGKVCKPIRGARSVIELPVGRISETRTNVGQAVAYRYL